MPLFVYAAALKRIDQTFRVQLGKSPMLNLFAGFVAWFIPSVEIIIAMAGMICGPKWKLQNFSPGRY